MKTVQSHVLSSDPISLSDATSFLSAFNKAVCGGGGAASLAASHETCWFVRRALASFEELEQLHHKLKGPKSDRNRRSESQNDGVETTVGDNPAQSFVSSRDVSSMPTSHRHDDVIDRKVAVEEESKGGSRNLKEEGDEIAEIDDKKKKKKETKVKGAIGNIGENGGRIEEGDGESEMRNGEVKREKKKKKKKRDNVDESGGEIKEEEDGEGKMGSEEAKKEEKKKRKGEVLENGEVDALEEQQEKRKKRRKS